MKKIAYISFIVLLVSCQNVEKIKAPDNLIPRDQMVDVLTDVYIYNASRSFNSRIVRDAGFKLDSAFYAKNEIDSTQFAQSSAFYAANLDIYDNILQQVLVNLNKKKEETTADKKAYELLEKKRDSLRRLKIAGGEQGSIDPERIEENELSPNPETDEFHKDPDEKK